MDAAAYTSTKTSEWKLHVLLILVYLSRVSHDLDRGLRRRGRQRGRRQDQGERRKSHHGGGSPIDSLS